MAILKFGVIVTGARGTIAGTIFSANKAGPFARGWARGANPRTSGQAVIRGYTSTHPAAWRAITQNQRDAWDVWAAKAAQEKTNSLGETYYASGFNWFVAINNRLLGAGRAVRQDCPTIARPAAPPLTDWRLNKSNDTHNSRCLYVWNTFLGFDVVHFVALANSEGVISKTFGWRLLDIRPPETEASFWFQDEIEASFGTIQLNQRGFYRIARQTTDGVRSAFTTGYADAQSGA